MTEHRVMRGLAASAVAALALTGLAAAPAYAAPSADLLSIFNDGRIASTRPVPDLASSISLTGVVEGDDVTAVQFEYNPDPEAEPSSPGWVPTGGTTDLVDGFATTEWYPNTSLVGTTVAVRLAVADADGTTYSARHDVALRDAGPEHSVRLQSQQGFFEQPYADTGHTSTYLSVEGTTSATSGDVEISAWRSAEGEFQGQTDAAVRSEFWKAPSGPTTAGRFQGAIDITAYDVEANDRLPISAELDSDDVELASLYAQVVNTIEVEFERTTPPTDTTHVAVTVSDQFDRPVVGAELRRVSDGALVGYTDADGVAAGTQPSGTVERYYVNLTDADGFESGLDPVTGDQLSPAWLATPWATAADLADGDAFDIDEFLLGDIGLQALDQRGDPYRDVAQVGYAIYPAGEEPPAITASSTNAQGRLTVPFFPMSEGSSYVLRYGNPSGAPEEIHEQPFVAGDATLSLTPGAGSAASGGQITYTGRLAVGDTPLPGRTIDLELVRGTELAPGAAADAGIGAPGGPLTSTAVTAEDGTFTVVVADTTETGGPAETGGRLVATAVAADETAQATVDFTAAPPTPGPTPPGPTPPAPIPPKADPVKVKLKLSGTSKGRQDRLSVEAPTVAAGETVRLHRKKGRTWVQVGTRTLDADGDLRFSVTDPNGKKTTLYRVTLVASDDVRTATATRGVK